MKNRIYLDYNSTSPFSKRLISYLGKGDFPFANPSSLHAQGKHSRKIINESASYIAEVFGIKLSEFDIVFNSGSTEGIRTFFEAAKVNDTVFYCESDHPAMLSTVKLLKAKGIDCVSLAIDGDGNLLIEEAIETIQGVVQSGASAFVNYLVLHNETGVYWPLSEAARLKAETGAKVHVDATQLPGKALDWQKLDSSLDAYTFSAHKFGALKGLGFSFVKKDFDYQPLFKGGGQQGGARGGTENALGIHSAQLALEDILESDLNAIASLRDEVESILLDREDVLVVGKNSKFGRGVNTICFALKNKKADIGLIQFDMAGFDISSGSACSAGSVEPSKTLLEMGLHEYAKNGLRISFGQENLKDAKAIKEKLSTLLSKL